MFTDRVRLHRAAQTFASTSNNHHKATTETPNNIFYMLCPVSSVLVYLCSQPACLPVCLPDCPPPRCLPLPHVRLPPPLPLLMPPAQRKAYYPKREELFDADDVILFEHVSADVVFEPPPELAAWLLETETSQASSPPVDEPQARAWRPPLLPSLAVSATLLTAAGLSLRMRLRKRARAQRANLALALDRLDSVYKACAGDPARDPGMSRGHPRDRKAKVEAQLAFVRGVMAIDLAKPETQLAFVRGVMAKNLGATYQSHPRIVWRDDALKPAAEKLSRRLARLERADNELEIMVEVKRVIDRIDAGDLFCEDQAGGRFPRADDGGLGRRRGKGGDSDADDDGDDDGGGVVQPPRLAKRAKALRDAPTVDDSGEARKSLCVFPEELDQCCADLEEKELFATDTVKEGLEGWDLTKVDGALAKLKLLGRSDLATKFRDNRQQVRTKIERLRNELKVRGGGGRGVRVERVLAVWIQQYSAYCTPGHCRQSEHVALRRGSGPELEAMR